MTLPSQGSARCCRHSGKSAGTSFRRITWMCSCQGSASLWSRVMISSWICELKRTCRRARMTSRLIVDVIAGGCSTCTACWRPPNRRNSTLPFSPCFLNVTCSCYPNVIAWSALAPLSALSPYSRNCHRTQFLTRNLLIFANSSSRSASSHDAVHAGCWLYCSLALLFIRFCHRQAWWLFGRWGWMSLGFRDGCTTSWALRLLWSPCPIRGKGQTDRRASFPYACVRSPRGCESTSP